MNSWGCGLRSIGLTSFSLLYEIYVSILSLVKTSPWSKYLWSFSRASKDSAKEPGVDGIFAKTLAGAS